MSKKRLLPLRKIFLTQHTEDFPLKLIMLPHTTSAINERFSTVNIYYYLLLLLFHSVTLTFHYQLKSIGKWKAGIIGSTVKC